MSSQSSRFNANQQEKKPRHSDHQQRSRNTKFVDTSTRDGRKANTPYSISQSQFNKGSQFQHSQQSNRIQEQSQNSRDGSFLGKVTGVITGFLGKIFTGSQVASQNDRIDLSQPYALRKNNRIMLDDYSENMCDVDDYIDQLKWENRLKDDEELKERLKNNFSFQGTQAQNSLKQSKDQDFVSSSQNTQHQIMSQITYQNRNDAPMRLQPTTANFNNLHLIDNQSFKSMWSKYNRAPFMFVKSDPPRRAKFYNCIKTIIEDKVRKERKIIVTADNKRMIFSDQLQRKQNRMLEPIARKQALKGVPERRKRDQFQPQYMRKPSQQIKRFDYEDEDMPSQSQTTIRPQLFKPQGRAVEQTVSKIMNDEDMMRHFQNVNRINDLATRAGSVSTANQDLPDKIVDKIATLLKQNLEQQTQQQQRKKNFVVAPPKEGPHMAMLIEQQKNFQKELQEQTEMIQKKQKEEIEKLFKDQFQVILQTMNQKVREAMEEKEKQMMSQIPDSQQSNLINQTVLEEIQKLAQTMQQVVEKQEMMASQNSFRVQSDRNSSSYDHVSESPRINLISQQKDTQLKKSQTETQKLQPIKEESKGGSQEEEKKQQSPKAKAPSFGNPSLENSNAQIEKQESFISVAISTPESKKSEAREDNKPVAPVSFKFAAFPAPTTTTGGAQTVNLPKFTVNTAPVNPQPAATTVQNQGSNTTSSTDAQQPPVTNPFMKASPTTTIQPASNPLLNQSKAASNPFLQPTPASNPFAPNPVSSGSGSMNSSFQANNNSTSNPFAGGNTTTAAPITNQFTSPFANNQNKQPSLPAFTLNTNNTSNNFQPPTFNSGTQFSSSSNQNSNPFAKPGNFNTNTNSNSSFGPNNNNFNNNSQPFASNTNQSSSSGSFGFNQSSNAFTGSSFGQNNNSRTTNPFANTTNLQPPQQQSQGSNFNSNPFSGGSGYQNNLSRSSFNAGNTTNFNTNPFQSNSNGSGGSNPFIGGGDGSRNQGFNENKNTSPGDTFSIGQAKKNNANNADSNDDLFGTDNGGRKMYKAKRNF